jgi:shikimate dehydrogenase
VRLVLLGDPVAHSRSPAIQEAALAGCGIEGRYTRRRVDAVGLYRAVGEMRAGGLDGANITMPHKGLAARACDRLSAEAAAARSVNTLVREAGEVVGHSTDVTGLRAVLARLGLDPAAPVLLLGSGGAAAAALVALAGRRVRVAARSGDAAARLIRSVGSGAPHPWGEALPGAVVVNATPLGMHGEHLPPGVLESACGLLDMPYGDQVTPAVSAARNMGAAVADGLDILVAQAADSFRLWTGREAPVDVMLVAARA